ncbi:hypothetical protein ACFQMA_14390 [Halosimplex aquaticum]|uniref:Uncharacterized protein n=1 Tax=Halosimplex aquaticum TaxID=3026162 RepID=A0ABD5Y6Q9_9EURY|nr:hypothetical protein [Halosimplex aquaticum]
MVTLDWSLERSDGVTLVGLVVAAERPCRVRIENRLDGPVWPPRCRGQPADGWEDSVFTGDVPAEGRLTVGYATPASPADPPAEVVATEPAPDHDGTGSDETAPARPVPTVESTPAGVVRALGDPVVPRDSVPVPDTSRSEPDGTPERRPGGDRSDGPVEDCEGAAEPTDADASPRPEPRQPDRARAADRSGEVEKLVVPSGVRAWLRDVEARLEADRNASECGRADGSQRRTAESALASARAADRQALRRVRRRADALLARTEESCRADPECERTDAGDAGTAGR